MDNNNTKDFLINDQDGQKAAESMKDFFGDKTVFDHFVDLGALEIFENAIHRIRSFYSD